MQEIRDWLKDPKNRGRFLDDMVWFIHDRFGMVCSTTTCSKIKRKWVKVIEAEERGESLDPTIALEQVRQEAFRVGKRPAAHHQAQIEQDPTQQHLQHQQPLPAPTAPMMQVQMPMEMLMQHPMQQHHESQIDRQLQQQIQSEVAHAALHHHAAIQQ